MIDAVRHRTRLLTLASRRSCRSRVLLSALSALLLSLGLEGCGETLSETPSLRGESLAPTTGKERQATKGPLAAATGSYPFFTDSGGRRAVYLTGSHTWNTFQDWGPTDPPAPFDYSAYLDFLERHGHNFIRLYVWEQAAWFPRTERKIVIAPLPYLRPGPGDALDGGKRFDLTRFNSEYFRRLRERVDAARARGIYVSVMLFDGWSVDLKGEKAGNPWRGHPFNRENNINAIDGDPTRSGEGKGVHTLANAKVTALQKAYLRKVVETVGELDNVLWEISNESDAGSVEWQYAMIRSLKALESERGIRHPVGMTPTWPAPADANKSLFDSPADWISPYADSAHPLYRDDPPAFREGKVVLTDTDHLWGVGGSTRWVWKSFLRGMNPLFMDPYQTTIYRNLPAWPEARDAEAFAPPPSLEWEKIRVTRGYARALADRVDLAAMRPLDSASSTRYCLADPGKEYLVYVPFQNSWQNKLLRWLWKDFLRESVQTDLSAAPGEFAVEWLDIERGLLFPGEPVSGGRRVEFRAPFAGDAILHLKAHSASANAARS